jgi:hypothetical protein
MKWFSFGNGGAPDLVLKAHDPARARRLRLLLIAGWLLSLAAVWLIASYRAAPDLIRLQAGMHSAGAELGRLRAALEKSERKLSISEKSDQVSRTANESLQATLRAQQDEIADLRSDIAFFQRLMDGKSGRKGLTVQKLAVRPIDGGRGYNLRATLTQTLRKGEVTRGSASISVEGMQNGRVVTLAWDALAGKQPAADPQFSFRYFQQLDSTLVLPDGFTPNRIKLALRSEQGDKGEQAFTWSQAITDGGQDDVWQ